VCILVLSDGYHCNTNSSGSGKIIVIDLSYWGQLSTGMPQLPCLLSMDKSTEVNTVEAVIRLITHTSSVDLAVYGLWESMGYHSGSGSQKAPKMWFIVKYVSYKNTHIMYLRMDIKYCWNYVLCSKIIQNVRFYDKNAFECWTGLPLNCQPAKCVNDVGRCKVHHNFMIVFRVNMIVASHAFLASITVSKTSSSIVCSILLWGVHVYLLSQGFF